MCVRNVFDMRPIRRRKAYDGRTSRARRFRALMAAFSEGFGGKAGARETSLIRQAAACTIEAEDLQAKIINGEHVDPDVLVRVSNVLARSLSALGLKRSGKADQTPSLADYLATKGKQS